MMKRIFSRALPFLLCAVLLLSSCSRLPKMNYRDGVYTNSKTGISYLQASVCYEAISYHEDSEVAHIKRENMEDLLVYPINGVAPEQMLASADYDVFYAVGTTLPTLAEMNPDKLHICRTVEITYALQTVTKLEDIRALMSSYAGVGVAENKITPGLTPTRYDLKFESSIYPGIYYCLTYRQYTEAVLIWELIENPEQFEILYPNVPVTVEDYDGEWYAVYDFGTELLYDRTTGLCYPAGDIVSGYLDGPTAIS